MSLFARIQHWIDQPRPMRPVVVDRAARDRMARLVRALATRRIDNVEFDDRAEEIASAAVDDPALFGVYLACWFWYDDLRRHRLPRLKRDQRREFAKMILFLRSDCPYCWAPPTPRIRMFRLSDQIWNGLLAVFVGWWIPLISLLRLLFWYLQRSGPVLIVPREPDHAARDRVWPFPDDNSSAIARRTHYLLGRPSWH